MKKGKNKLQREEDKPSILHSLSCMPNFTFHERCLGEEMMIQEGIDIIKHIEGESYIEMKPSSSIPTEVKLNSYGSFKVQGNSMRKNFYEKNNDDRISNELVEALMEKSDEENSYDVFIPRLCWKSLDGNFLYEENIFFNPLFLEKNISIDDSQVGI